MRNSLSLGSWIIITLACLSSLLLIFIKDAKPEGQSFWIFSKHHEKMYRPIISEWNSQASEDGHIPVDLTVISIQPLERRLLSGFLSGTPVPDLVEIEVAMASRFFAGPVEAIGFSDLTDKIKAEGLDKRLNPPSFSPWMRNGRIYGLPNDVHPVLLGYRADIIEAAGIDVSLIETWDDFIRILSPLMKDIDGDGNVDRYLIDVWENDTISTEILLYQAGGGYFDENSRPIMNSAINAKVLATITTWITGKDRIGASVVRFDASGNQQRLEGYVLCHLLPDWYAGGIQTEVPGLSGKMKLMKLPAWEPGGRRTSAYGGTMAAIPKRSDNKEAAWSFIKKLYLDKEVARNMYQSSLIVSPVKEFWNAEYYKDPVPYYSNQPVGSLYIEMAPDVPFRQPSPFLPMARERMTDALIRIKRTAAERNLSTAEEIFPFAMEELDEAQAYIERKIQRNKFIQPDAK